MFQSPLNTTDLRLILPEVIWLETEQFHQAKEISKQVLDEAQQWQSYLNTLGLFGFEQWLSSRIPNQPIYRETKTTENICYLTLGEFKFCLIVTEHLLDEVVSISDDAIHQPELVAHFYVLLEVSEEQEEVIIRGSLRYDQLISYCSKTELQNGYYQFPFFIFDTEPNHLLHYCLYLEPSSIPLPVTSTEKVSEFLGYVHETRTKLGQWLQGVFDESWQIIDAFVNPEASLAFNTRNIQSSAKKAKLIDFGMQLGQQTVALLVNLTEEVEEKLGVLIQLHPTGGERFLPPNIKLTLLSKAGKVLQEVTSRSQDNYIQLKPFKGESGKLFSIEVNLGNVTVKENFEL